MKVLAQGEARAVRAPWSHQYCRYWSAGAMLLLRSVIANRRSASQPKTMQRSSSVKGLQHFSRFRARVQVDFQHPRCQCVIARPGS